MKRVTTILVVVLLFCSLARALEGQVDVRVAAMIRAALPVPDEARSMGNKSWLCNW
jgi:hypothetical protein